MRTLRMMIVGIGTAWAVTGCHHSPTSTPPPAGPPAPLTALNSNPRVIDRGHCHFLVDISTLRANQDREAFERPLSQAIEDFREARAAGADRRTLIRRAHVVRKLYWRMMNLWRRPLLEEWGGP